ncbi:hypothetical protein QBC35DRAFT_531289 [Podospora australis]|uniref:Ubiquitin-like domain-containing protein n=1 Tax=Podospora australis TaxID=1536484 RepID=A0AAN6WUZ0_9PEZI|nr:hypothetical protein QBC35DRAFT_531289 [Podospora australis]
MLPPKRMQDVTISDVKVKSAMASAGEIIAILGLFERVVMEQRNYKDAPAHFQQLTVELDSLSSTWRHASQLQPSNDDERRTLDKVGAIARHCLIPLQAMADNMRSKEGSLGNFRTTRSLASIGTRLHWSMISRKDIDGLRTTILSEMLAINMLLSTQQLAQIKRLSPDAEQAGNAQSALIEKHSSALMRQTSSIFTVVAATPKAIADLQSLTVKQATERSRESQAIRTGLEAVTTLMEVLSVATSSLAACSKEMLKVIGRNTRLLLHFANQMKRVVQVMEAIPHHVDLDIVRLDDALGDTWGLPLQGCKSWQYVVFAGRPGLYRVATGQFAITHVASGLRLDQYNWEALIKRDVHIQQAMALSRPSTSKSQASGCPFPVCAGEIVKGERLGTW